MSWWHSICLSMRRVPCWTVRFTISDGVGHTIAKVKEELESQIGQELTEVCIAAAGRVLKTVTTNISYDFPEETVVTGEDHSYTGSAWN